MFAALTCSLFIAGALFLASSANAATVWEEHKVTWADTGKDTTFLQDETDTTRTDEINVKTWDLAALMQTNGVWKIPVMFTATGSAIPVATDTIYFTVEKRAGTIKGTSTAIFTPNRTLVAAAGASAITSSGIANERVWYGHLIFDNDAGEADNSVDHCASFRLRVAGDQSGTSPVVSGLSCTILFPKRVW